MKVSSAQYWHRTRNLTLKLLALWLLITFGIGWFARELNNFFLAGFPLGFYMAAQGALVVYLAIIWFYNRCMKKLDAEFGIED